LRQLNIAVAASVLALAACGAGGRSSEGGDVAQVPEAVQQLLAAKSLADGPIHLQSRGVFKIRPSTLFCEIDASVAPEIRKMGVPGLGIDGVRLAALIEGFGQTYYIDGSLRQRSIRTKQCPGNGSNIIYQGHVQFNRASTPYKLILAVWQGDPAKGGAVWIGGVERLNGRRPDAVPPFYDGMGDDHVPTPEEIARHMAVLSIGRDSNELTDLLLSDALRNAGFK
jgi:hypothetical protein